MKKFEVIFKENRGMKDTDGNIEPYMIDERVIIDADYYRVDSNDILLLENKGMLIGSTSFDTPVASFKEWSRITEYNSELD